MSNVAVATTRWGGRRAFPLALGAALAALVLAAPSAQAATVQATCANFGATLAAAASDETIVLTGMCTNTNTGAYDGSFTLPAVAGLTIQGAAGGTNGFDGTGIITSPALSTATAINGLTLAGLTFRNYHTSLGAVRITGLISSPPQRPFEFTGDTFANDSATTAVDGGGLSLSMASIGTPCSYSSPGALTLADSSFTDDSTIGSGSGSGGGGGGAAIDIECASGAATATITHNTFSGDSVTPTGPITVQGGGLFVGAPGMHVGNTVPVTVIQSDNSFISNSITGNGGNYEGGGEFVVGANLTSSGDRFTSNTLPGPSTSAVTSSGAGLAAVGYYLCSAGPAAISTAANLVAAGNTIGAPTGTGTGTAEHGAGAFIGCQAGGSHGYTMTLNDSTLAGNVASGVGGTAGLEGAAIDTLTTRNTILAGNSGGRDLGGFGATAGANVTATFSDLCAVGSTTTPFSTGNLCAAPNLVDPISGDVHQTDASPTIDAGSNAAIPVGVSTDVFGNPRTARGRPTASSATVDIGAAENILDPSISDCSQLQPALSSAVSGDVITLGALCSVTNSGSSQGVFTLPTGLSALTLQGSGGTVGFDGTGASGSALSGSGTGLTLKNLTIENYALNHSTAVQLSLGAGGLPAIDGDHFTQDSNTSSVSTGGALEIVGFDPSCPYTGALTIANSAFTGNRLQSTASAGTGAAGGGAAVMFGCDSAHSVNLSISHNTFSGNSIATEGASAYGAGLYVANDNNGQLSAAQASNGFTGNAITTSGAAGSYNGAGEWLASVDLQSTADAFTGNTLPGPSGVAGSSEGAGLGIVRGTCGSPPSSAAATGVLTGDVVAGNSIATPNGGGQVEGAGVYAGCEALQGGGGFGLTVRDSTVSGNSGPGGAAGIQGEGGDAVTLQNAIVTGNVGAGSTQIAGFGIGGGTGSVTSTFSDACAGGGTAPLSGAGNICASPALVSASTGDVHETASSPTINTGSNALIPPGLGTDFYGNARVFPETRCTPNVDIGAAEFQRAKAGACSSGNPTATTKVSHIKAVSGGLRLTLDCVGTATATCAGHVIVTSTETVIGSKPVAVSAAADADADADAAKVPAKHKRRKVTVRISNRAYALAEGKSKTMTIELTGKAKSLVAAFGKLPVRVTVTEKNATGKTTTVSSRKLQIKRKHHNRKHHR
jgi:hypothetical protein